MTTPNIKYNETSNLYRMLEGMGRDIKDIGASVRGMNDSVGDLLARTESIYDAVSRHPYSRTDGMTDDSFWDDIEE